MADAHAFDHGRGLTTETQYCFFDLLSFFF